MSEHISNREVREIVKEWESLRPTVTHEYSSGIVGTNRSAEDLDRFKRLSTVLSVAAQERGIDAGGIDALAVEPTITNPRALAEAELAIGKLKIMTIQTSAIPAGTYQTYRSMLEHPAIRQARAKLVARIKSADLQSEMTNGATAELQLHAEKLIERLRISFLSDAATMLDYGWVGFEVIFETKNPSLGNVYLEVERLKWLLPDITTILLDKNGIFAGLRNGAAENEQVDVGCSNVLCMALRAPGDGREVSYGRSQLENVRHLWGQWKSGLETDNIDQRLYDGYFGSPDANAGLEQTARDVLDACEIAINELLDRILIWHVGEVAKGKLRLRAILKPVATNILMEKDASDESAPLIGNLQNETPSIVNATRWAGIGDIQRHFHIPKGKYTALDGRLKRFRKENAGNGKAIVEHDAPARNEPRYLYNLAMIEPLVIDLAVAPNKAPDARPTEISSAKN